jgi:hypothetical protein
MYNQRRSIGYCNMRNNSLHLFASVGGRLDFSLSEQCAMGILLVALLVHVWSISESFKRRRCTLSASLFQPRTTTARRGRNRRNSSSPSSSSLVNHLPEIGLTLTQDHLDPIASRKVCFTLRKLDSNESTLNSSTDSVPTNRFRLCLWTC